MKKKNKLAGLITWAAVSVFAIGVGVTANVMAKGPYNELVSILLGKGKPIFASGGDNQIAYEGEYKTKDEALEKSNALNVEFAKEGVVMLKNKNNALPLANGAKVSVFGKNSVNLVYGGSGSGGVTVDEYTKNLYDSLKGAGFQTNPELEKFYKDSSRSGSGRAENPGMNSGGVPGFDTGETPVEKYDTAVKNSYSAYNDAAIVVFSRIGGEGADLPRTCVDKSGNKLEGARNGDDHYLQLDQNETDLLKEVCEGGFSHVIVLINSAAAMELGFLDDATHYAYQEKIDGALWMAGPGKSGVMALGEILNGNVSPSGRVCDTYSRDFKKDPTWNNFGNNRVTNGDRYTSGGRNKAYYFVDYEESIYVGYRYYETRGLTDGEEWYKNNVVFPFGYGLSYTTFNYNVTNKTKLNNSKIDPTKKITIEVEVENTGSVASKEVVEIYATAPYSAGGIEKAYKVLCGFEKTPLIEPGKKAKVSVEVDPYTIASYDCYDKNANGFKGWELEGGQYTFHVSKNAHEAIDTIDMTLDASHKYENDNVTGTKIENLFDDVDDQLQTQLSRTDWEGTWPQTRTAEQKDVDAAFLDELKSTEPNRPDDTFPQPKLNAEEASSVAEEVASGEISEDDGLIKLRDLIGADYNDPRWETLLDRITFQEMLDMFNKGAFHTNAILSIGKPRTNDSDGPVGWTNFMEKETYFKTCSYAGEALLGCTWNKEIMKKLGESIGNEALLGDKDGIPYTGWYAPAVNIHRSPFGGRNFEYFAEDGFLSGQMATQEIIGCRSKGVITELKHFALNDQETNRSTNGVCTWATEQSMREIYLRPFELAVKNGKCTGIMSSFNRLGRTWAGGSYTLLTKLLRNEWGFNGVVICDYNDGTLYMGCKMECYAGGNVNLASRQDFYWNDANPDDPKDVIALRDATHGTLYAYANSNALNVDVLGYGTPTWEVVMYVVDAAVVTGLGVWGFFAIKKFLDLKKAGEAAEA